MDRKNSGFTLVEMVVSVAILAILVSLVTINAGSIIARERVTRIQTDMKILEAAGNQYLYGRNDLTDHVVVSQEKLVEAGVIGRVLKAPIEGYVYRITVMPKSLVQVTMVCNERIYGYGEFEADTQSQQFN